MFNPIIDKLGMNNIYAPAWGGVLESREYFFWLYSDLIMD